MTVASGTALDPARFAIAGMAPRAAIRPASREELAEALAAAARDALAVVPWGGGVALGREAAPERYDMAIDISGLDRVVDYEPADLTLTAECGATLAALRATLAARGQELPLEAAFAGRATLGGTLAANASGPRRLRFGAPRDRILGARFALADGTLARSGGKVVKNVAGHGIHRMLCGSRGGLAILLEATLKLMPAPVARVALIYEATREQMAGRERWGLLPRLEPALVTALGSAGAGWDHDAAMPASVPQRGATAAPFTVIIGLEDDASHVDQQTEAVIAALGLPSARLEGDQASALWQRLADLEEQDDVRLSFTTAHNLPAAIAPLLDRPESARLVFHAPAGRLHLFPPAEEAPGLVALLAERGFSLIDARGGADLEPALPPQVAVGQLRSRIRAALDPGRRLGLGERWERSGF